MLKLIFFSLTLVSFVFSDVAIPAFYDLRNLYENCKDLLNSVPSQGACLSSWAIQAAQIVQDRYCIRDGLKIEIYPSTIMGCCNGCAQSCAFEQGTVEKAFRQMMYYGVSYTKRDGGYCLPAILPCGTLNTDATSTPWNPCKDRDFDTLPSCETECKTDNNKMFKTYLFGTREMKNYDTVKREIMNNGPVAASFTLRENFLTYTSGVYQDVVNSKALGEHTLKIIGWGKEGTADYWLAVNSFGKDWGEAGKVKMNADRLTIKKFIAPVLYPQM